MAKINNPAITGGSGPPVPPLDPPMYAYLLGIFIFSHLAVLVGTLILIAPVPDRCLLITFRFYLKMRL